MTNWWDEYPNAPTATDEKLDSQWWDEYPAVEDSTAPDMTPAEAGERMGKVWDTATAEELPVSLVNENFDEFERIESGVADPKDVAVTPIPSIDFDDSPFQGVVENVKDFREANKDYLDARRDIETQNTDTVKTFLSDEMMKIRVSPPEQGQVQDSPEDGFSGEVNLDALAAHFDQQKTARLPGEYDPLEDLERPLGEFDEVKVTAKEKLASVSPLDFEFIAQTIQNNPTQFDPEMVKMIDQERLVRALIDGLRKAPEGDQIKATTLVQFANIFNFNEFTSRYGINLPEKIVGIVEGDDADGLYSAALEASARFVAEKNQADPFNIARIAGVGADVSKAVVEFGLISLAMGPGAFAKMPAAVRPFLAAGTKFAVRDALQAPREGETAAERLSSVATSGAYGAAMAGAGKFVPAGVRVPLMPVALGGLTYAQTGDIEQALETGATVLGFQAIGLFQKGMKFSSQRVRNMYADKAIKEARKHNPDLMKFTNQEVAKILETIARQKETEGMSAFLARKEARARADRAWKKAQAGDRTEWEQIIRERGLKQDAQPKPEAPAQRRGLALPAVQGQTPAAVPPKGELAPQAATGGVAEAAPVLPAPAGEGIVKVYRGELPPQKSGRKITGIQEIENIIYGDNAVFPPSAPLEFYTTDIDDAIHYAEMDNRAAQSYEEASKRQGLEIFKALHGSEPRQGQVKEYSISPKKTLDLTYMGDKSDQFKTVEMVNDVLGNKPLPKDWRWKDVPQNVNDALEKYHLLSVFPADGSDTGPVYMYFRNTANMNMAIAQAKGLEDIKPEYLAGNNFANFLRDYGYDSVSYLHASEKGNVNHYVILKQDDPAGAETLDTPSAQGTIPAMTGDKASRDIAPQDNAGGKGEVNIHLEKANAEYAKISNVDNAIANNLRTDEQILNHFKYLGKKPNTQEIEKLKEKNNDARAFLNWRNSIAKYITENLKKKGWKTGHDIDSNAISPSLYIDYKSPNGEIKRVRISNHGEYYTNSGGIKNEISVSVSNKNWEKVVLDFLDSVPSFNPPATAQGGETPAPQAAQTSPSGATTGKAEYGTKNRVVTESEYEEILNRQKKAAKGQRKPGGKRKGTAYTPGGQDFKDLVRLGMYHLEAGSRNFGEWSKRMMKDAGINEATVLEAVFAKALNDFEGQSKERKFIASVRALNPELKVEGQYIPKSNDVLSMKARNLVKDNLAEAERIARAPKDDNGVAVLTEVIKHYNGKADAAKDDGERNLYLDRAAEVANEAARFLTEAGRTVQAASLLSRLTPEGQIRFAAREIQKYNEQIEKNRGGLGGLKKKIPELTGEQADYIRKEMEAIHKMPEGEDRHIRLHKLNRFISDLVPTPFFDKLNTVWRAGLLTGIKTSGLNIFSNQAHFLTESASEAIATPIDMAIGLLTGERTRSFTMKGTGKGAAVGMRSGLRYLQTGYDSRNVGAKLDYKQINWGQHPMWKAIGTYADTVFKLLGTEDQPFYYAAYMRSLGEQAKVQAINQGKKGADAQKVIDHLVNNPTEEMLQRAANDAEIVVFQQESGFAKIATTFQGVKMADINIGRWILAFGKTPANVAVQMVNYTPVGGVAAIIDNIGKGRFNQRDFTKAMGRSILGTGAMVIGAALFRAGMVALDMPNTEQEREQWRLEGRKPNSIKIDGKWRSAHILGPVGNVLLMGAHFQSAYDETGSISEAAEKGLFGSAKSFTEQTFLTGMSRVLDAITDPERSAGGLVAQHIASFIPTLISDIARSTDPLERRADTVVEKVMARIPGLRQELEPQVSALGQERERAGTFWETMLDPTRPSAEIDDPVVNELRRLMDAGYPATPTLLGGREGYDVLTPEENTELRKRAGELIYTAINRIISAEGYSKHDDIKTNEAKSDVINDSIRLMRFIAKYEMFIQKTKGLSGVDLCRKIQELQDGKFATRDIVDVSPEEIREMIESFNKQ